MVDNFGKIWYYNKNYIMTNELHSLNKFEKNLIVERNMLKMREKIKRITAVITAAVMTVSMSVNTYASEAAESDHVQVGEYECHVENGQYFTEIDGETYLVIDLDDGSTEDDSFNISTYSTNWENGRVIDISDGSYYCDTINASKAVDCTPIFQGNPGSGYKFTAVNLAGINVYKVNIHYFNTAFNKWYSEEKTLTFIMEIATSNILFTSSTSQLIKKICLEFYSDGIFRIYPFTYKMQQC